MFTHDCTLITAPGNHACTATHTDHDVHVTTKGGTRDVDDGLVRTQPRSPQRGLCAARDAHGHAHGCNTAFQPLNTVPAGDALTFHEHADLGSAHDIACFSFLVGMRQLVATMTGKPAAWIAADLPLAEPAYFARFSHLLPNARFGQPRMRVIFDTRGLDVPLLAPDRAALRLAVEACERDLAALGFEHQLAERVRRAAIDHDGFRSITEVAKQLGMSTRTLKRKLAAQQLTFSDLVDNERLGRAVDLLCAPDRTLDEIADKLGYSSVANFTRAFRRWTQLTPTQHRKQRR